MDAKTLKQAIKTYNDIMYSICLEHLTIGTNFSEGTDGWNIRDMVCEMQYQYEIYNDESCLPYLDAHSDCQPMIQIGNRIVGEMLYSWQKENARMKRFINKYEPISRHIACSEEHCGMFG